MAPESGVQTPLENHKWLSIGFLKNSGILLEGGPYAPLYNTLMTKKQQPKAGIPRWIFLDPPPWLTIGSYSPACLVNIQVSFLAHLSRRLMGELIVYQSLRRPSVRPSVRRPSVRPSTFSNIFSSETTGPIKLKFHMETP